MSPYHVVLTARDDVSTTEIVRVVESSSSVAALLDVLQDAPTWGAGCTGLVARVRMVDAVGVRDIVAGILRADDCGADCCDCCRMADAGLDDDAEPAVDGGVS